LRKASSRSISAKNNFVGYLFKTDALSRKVSTRRFHCHPTLSKMASRQNVTEVTIGTTKNWRCT
jgi:hypothetical protein